MSTIKIYGYASLRTGHTKEELKKNFENTKLYAEYIDIINIMKNQMIFIDDDEITPDFRLIENNMEFNPDKVLQIDVMTSKRSGMHYKLDCIIEQSKKMYDDYIANLSAPNNIRIRRTMNTVIILNSISALGSCEDIKNYYAIFHKEKIGVLIPDYTRKSSLSEYSTVGYNFETLPESICSRAYDFVAQLEPKDVDNRGRIGKNFTTTFRIAFWLYELFKIPEQIAVKMSGYSKNGFHMKADHYEQTQNYREELDKMENVFGISSLIKRNRTVPKDFSKLTNKLNKNGDLELACISCKIPMIFPIDYQRLLLKANGGKKELARCLKLYDEKLINSYNEWIDAGNDATTFYKQCNMEQYLVNTYEINQV